MIYLKNLYCITTLLKRTKQKNTWRSLWWIIYCLSTMSQVLMRICILIWNEWLEGLENTANLKYWCLRDLYWMNRTSDKGWCVVVMTYCWRDVIRPVTNSTNTENSVSGDTKHSHLGSHDKRWCEIYVIQSWFPLQRCLSICMSLSLMGSN